jgi:tetratricopeptide (TPR) repeat protein
VSLAGIAIFLAATLCGSQLSAGFQMTDGVQKAYQLRMEGKADESTAMLQLIIARNPQDAEAHYELARTVMHMGFGAPQEIQSSMEAAEKSIARAIEIDAENVNYHFFAGKVAFCRAYLALQKNDPAAKDLVAKMSAAYQSILELCPDCHSATLYLIEIHTILSPAQGGDRSMAEHLSLKLAEENSVWKAKAQSLLLPEGSDAVEYWQKALSQYPDSADVLHELGRAYLFKDDVEAGVECMTRAMQLDPDKSILWLDIARYHIMRGWRDQAWLEKGLPLAEKAITTYLASGPQPPLQAYALGLMAKIKSSQKDAAGAEKLFREAESLDPYFSKAMGIPASELFVSPGTSLGNHRYLFTPM